MLVQETDLNKIFAEIDRQRIKVYISRRREWEINLTLESADGRRDQMTVTGEGPSLREALTVAFNRIGELANLLEWKPEPSDIEPPPYDDDIPF